MGKFRKDVRQLVESVFIIIVFLVVVWLAKPLIEKHPGESIVLGGCALVVIVVIRATGGKNGR
jgi:hypothetical protein